MDDRAQATLMAREWMEARPVFLDTETTALDGEVCEIAVVDADGTVLLDSLVRPQGAFHPDATAVHGIDAETVKDAPTFEEIWERLRSVIEGRLVVVYNAQFDRGRLIRSAWDGNGTRLACFDEVFRYAGERDAMPDGPGLPRWECAMKLYARFFGERNFARGGSYKWQKLEKAYGDVVKEGERLNAHRARGDAEMCRRVVLALAEDKGSVSANESEKTEPATV